MRQLVLLVSSFFYSGYFPIAPGTAGTIATIPLYILLSRAHPAVYAAVTIFLFLIGTWSANYAAVIHKRKDPPKVVIDETVGFLVTMAFIPFSWKALVIGFLIARILDIIKPPPARQAESLHGGTGIMMDDVVSGVYGNILMWVLVGMKLI